jgi:hypothetical protein
MFCGQQKMQLSVKEGVNFYHLIFFDDSLYADFPISGVFYIRERQLEHIKAIYTLDPTGRISELETYTKNKVESPPNKILIK